MGTAVGLGVEVDVGWGMGLEWGQAWRLERMSEMVSGWPPELEALGLMLGEPREQPWVGARGLPPAWALEPMLLVASRWADELA